ncbi:telomere-associated protein Tap [Kitasatospora sp. NPDC059973]|uniref:telomere-associated protein Tap n=1 Tax=Kitasatospora sp. NPDC059973 TaxID=3347020 RepID=UPI0036A5E7C9
MTTEQTSYTAPLVVLDVAAGELVAYRPDVQLVELPGEVVDLATAAEWALAYGLGAPGLGQFGEDFGPLLVLTEAATERLGLPVRLEDRRNLRLPEDHPARKALTEAGWDLSRAGMGPWTLLFKGRTECRFAFLPWGAFDTDLNRWEGIGDSGDPAALAYTLGLFAERVIPPTGSTAATGLELMTALRPPTRLDWKGGRMQRVPVSGSLVRAIDPALPEAIDEHPIAAGRTREQSRNPRHVVMEEPLIWCREPTEEERALPFAVGLDVCMAFGAASNRLPIGLGEAVHTDGPKFDKKIPGAWLADFSGVKLRAKDLITKEWRDLPEDFPSPFTPDGRPPTGPAWYETPTLAYAVELGVEVQPLEGWLRVEPAAPGLPEVGGYFDLWYQRIQAAYMATLADLGVTEDMPEAEFVAAMATINERDPEAAALLRAIKKIVKGGIGKMAEKPQGRQKREPHTPWPALKRPTYSPHARYTVISAARTGAHRKAVKTWLATGAVPLAVLSDCWVYASPLPSALAVVPRKADGTPLPGGWRLGPNPGYVKEEGVKPMEWYLDLMAKGQASGKDLNPARFIKGRDAMLDGE